MYEVFDLTQRVPELSVSFLTVTCALAVTVPLVAIYLFRKIFRSEFKALFCGIADHLTLEFMLCSILWTLLALVPVFQSSSAAYIIIGLIITCLISEGGRYFMMSMLKQLNISFGGLFLFATGIFTANSILNVMVPAFQNLVIALTINNTGLETLAAEAGENALPMLQSLEPILTADSFVYLISSFDLFVNLLFHIAATMLIYAVYTKRIQNYYLPIVMGLRFFYELPGYCYSYGILITNAYLAEGVAIVITAITAYLAYHILVVEMADELASLKSPKKAQAFANQTENTPSTSIRKNANILAGRKIDEK